MDDPIQRHPTRTEQLDILVRVLADSVPDGGHVLDLGCGTGYIDWMLLQRRGDLRLTGWISNRSLWQRPRRRWRIGLGR